MADITFAHSVQRRTASLDWSGESLTVLEPNLGPLVFSVEAEEAGHLSAANAVRIKLGAFLEQDEVDRMCGLIGAGYVPLSSVDEVLAEVIAYFRR